MKKSFILTGTLLTLACLSSCGETPSSDNPLSYIYVNDATEGGHYEVYYNGKASLPETIEIASSYDDGSHGKLSVTGFYYNESEGKGAFEGCKSLRDITVPNSIKSISKNAFKDCSLLTCFELDYDSQVASVEDRAFSGCTSLSFYRVSPALKSIGDYSFAECNCMVSLLDYDYCTLESIGDGAFLNDYSLYGVPKFNEVKTIGKDAFSRCSALDMVVLPSIVSLGEGAFYRCHNLETFQFSRNCLIEKIPVNCFFECRSLESLGLPYKVSVISDYAFAFCTALSSLECISDIESIGQSAFQSCSSLIDAPIGDLCESIGKDAFEDCTSLSEIFIPSTVTSIGGAAFNGCRNIRSLKVDANNPYFDSRNDCNAIITKVDIEGDDPIPANTLIAATPVTVIPNTVSGVLKGAFTNFHGAKELHIPNNITEIYSFFVSSCNDLETLVFDSGSAIKNLPSHAFFNLPKLVTLVLPDSLEVLESYSIYMITVMEEITLPITVREIKQAAFNGADNLGVINYAGTKEQFNAIAKEENWIKNPLPGLVVKCSDGNIEIA